MTYRKMGRAVMLCALQTLMMGMLSAVHSASPNIQNPQLSITSTQGAVLLSWPDWATNWVLEESAQLGPWTPISLGTNNLRITPSPATNGFFRLRRLSPIIEGLTGHWRFDQGGGEAADGPIVLFTNASWANGRVGAQSLRFASGSTAWVSNSSHQIIPSSGQPFSLSLWFSPDALPLGWSGLVGNDSAGWRVALHTPSVGTNRIVFASSSLNVSARALLLPSQWYELTVTYDGARGSVYLDGNLLASEAGQVTTDQRPIYFGAGVGGYTSFPGRIDEVRTYRTALTAEQVSLTGHWPFDEGAGKVVYDRNVGGNHGYATASAWAAGKSGSAMRLSGNEITIANEQFTLLPPTGGPFSLSLWLCPHSLSVGRSAIMSMGDGVNSDWELAMEVDDGLGSAISFTSKTNGGTLELRAAVPLTNLVWTRLDITHDGGITTLYANGQKIHSESGAIRGSRAPLRIGGAPGAMNFDGLIDELKIYRRERGASEIGPVATVMWETVFRSSSTNIVLQGSGPPGRALSYSILNSLSPSNGSITHASGSPVLTYHAGARKGPDALIFTVSDGEFTSIPATLTLSIVQPHWLSTNGGSVQPLDGSTPQQAWFAGTAPALDAIWRTNNFYDCFFYAPGTYETRGWRYTERGTARPGCKHVGAGFEGPQKTTIKLVGATETWNEELIFAPVVWQPVDAFEVHNMLLDCNAENNPKYTRGEPIWIRVPLTRTSRVENIALRWHAQTIASTAGGAPWQLGPAAEFDVCARITTGGYSTNCAAHSSTGLVDRIPLGVETDQIVVQLNRRAANIDFYGLSGLDVVGGQVSLPSATVPGGGESRFIPGNANHSILRAFDENMGTAWTSGLETNVEIALPLDGRTRVTHLTLHWNCQTQTGGALFGPASDYHIRARDPGTGAYVNVPFAREERTPQGAEVNVFTVPIETDSVLLVLTAREPGVNYYSLREVTLQNGWFGVPLRIPAALNAWFGSVMNVFDGAPETAWSSHSQGSISGISVTGNNLKFTRLKIIGFGTKAVRESFPMQLYNGWLTPVLGNVLVEDCHFSDPARQNSDGLTVIGLGGYRGSLTNGIIRRCSVRGVKQHFRYSHAFSTTCVENSLVDDCEVAVYFEPAIGGDDIGPVVIRSNQFLNVVSGVVLLFHSGTHFGAITYADNEIVLAERGGYGFNTCDICSQGPSGSITNLTALRNIVRYADWQPRPSGAEGGFYYSDIFSAVFANNIIALGTRSPLRVRHCPAGWVPPPFVPQRCPPHPQAEPPTEQGHYPACLDALPPRYQRAWLNNRDLSGQLLEVRFQNYGVDGPALQQQPPNELP